jgi:hypothetical protein
MVPPGSRNVRQSTGTLINHRVDTPTPLPSTRIVSSDPVTASDLSPTGGDVAVDRRGQLERYGVSLPFDRQEHGSAPPRGVAIGPG